MNYIFDIFFRYYCNESLRDMVPRVTYIVAVVETGSKKVAEHGSGARRHRGHFVGKQRLGKLILQKKGVFYVSFSS